jgi:small multidrug resistance pump|tara:strand:+ start:10890 stop:11219 length:330 start_codon:yes stop_codon:yes gene_type:complete
MIQNINMGYIYLLFAIISGCFTNSYLKKSDGFTKINPTLIAIFYSILLCFFLSKMYQTIKLGISYSLYAISLILFTSVWGYFLYKEKLNHFGVAGITLIIIGIICLYIK